MAVIAVYSVKGGVGKTTIAVNLAWCAANISMRHTLLWDLDPSGGAGYLLGIEASRKRSASAIFEKRDDPDRLIRTTPWPDLDILPADESLRHLDTQFMALGKRRRLAKLAEALSAKYDRIILDCPPVLNETSAQVIRAADLIIVPLPPSPLSRRAYALITEELTANHKYHPPILPVLSMFDSRRRLHKELREEFPDWPLIPMASAVEQMAVRQAPLGAFADKAPAAQRFARLWAGIEKKLAER